MHRKLIKNLLFQYKPSLEIEQNFKNEIGQFIDNEPDCFKRELLKGHITGSAFILNSAKTKAVLVHHAKLNCWLQPGGHADGETDIAAVALKEAQEETGLMNLTILPEIFDLDIHTIPARKIVPEHQHYDIRFLIMADENEEFNISNESTDIQWVSLNDLEKFEVDSSVKRMAGKIENRNTQITISI